MEKQCRFKVTMEKRCTTENVQTCMPKCTPVCRENCRKSDTKPMVTSKEEIEAFFGHGDSAVVPVKAANA
jgi:hypothetical protein